MESVQSIVSVVIDIGSGFCKAGLAGEGLPRIKFPTTVGRKEDADRVYFGDYAYRSTLTNRNRTQPVQNGIVNSWKDWENLLNYCYHEELHINSKEASLILTEATLNPKHYREKSTQIVFETFNVPAFYMANTARLSLFASGRTTGLVIESGYGVSRFIPIFDGYIVPQGVLLNDISAEDLTEFLFKLLTEGRTSMASSAEKDIVRDIKENKCYVALDFFAEKNFFEDSRSKDVEYKLPDGQMITLGNGLFICPEALFEPSIIGKESQAIHILANNSTNKCDVDYRKDLYANIVLAGGSTLFSGLAARLNKEVTALTSKDMKVNVDAPADRKYSAWIGGSKLSSASTFRSSWITKAEYEESETRIVHRKCF